MHFPRRTLAVLIAALALGACERAAPEPADASAVPQPPESATPNSTPPPPTTTTTAPAAPGDAPPEPTRADSIAAAKEDVSPEWKQRERSMGTYADCMAQAQAVTGPARAQIEQACANLPSAP